MIVASQMATYMVKTLKATARGSKIQDQPGFRWKNKGSMVLIGDNKASGHPADDRVMPKPG
jgi:NADH dehydrogenase FAD-containing subunit